MMRALGRIFLVALAFLLGATTALYVIVSLGQEQIVQALVGRAPEEIPLGAVRDLFALAVELVSVQTLLPALLLIIAGEVARIRSALYYVAGGGAVLASVPLLVRWEEPASALSIAPAVWQVLATAGFAGGLVYWLIAGRSA
jgi:hypothetical protein